MPAVAIGAFGYYSYLQNENARLQGEIATFAQRGREYDAITARYNQLLERQNRITSTLATVRHLTTTTVAYTDVVDRLIPRATQADDGAARGYLRTLTIDQANPLPIRDNADPTLEGTRFGVALGGTTRDAATIADIVAAFENDPSVEALFDRARTERGGEFDYEMRLAMVLPLPSASAPAPAEAPAPTPAPAPPEPAAAAVAPAPMPAPEPTAPVPTAPPAPEAPATAATPEPSTQPESAPAVTPSGLSPIPLRPPPGVNPNPEGQP